MRSDGVMECWVGARKVSGREMRRFLGRSILTAVSESANESTKRPKILVPADCFSVRLTRKDRIGWVYENIALDCYCCH